MVLNHIPDIRLFWSLDPRFLTQFSSAPGKITIFRPYSKYPPCYKDVSFWLPVGEVSEKREEAGGKAAGGGGDLNGMGQGGSSRGKVFHENDFCEIVRDVAGDLIETVELVSQIGINPRIE